MKSKLNQLNENDRAVYDNIINTLSSNFEFAKEYANRTCIQCTGKGYYDVDHIIPKSMRPEIEGKIIRTTPPQRSLCFCVPNRVVKQIQEVPNEPVA